MLASYYVWPIRYCKMHRKESASQPVSQVELIPHSAHTANDDVNDMRIYFIFFSSFFSSTSSFLVRSCVAAVCRSLSVSHHQFIHKLFGILDTFSRTRAQNDKKVKRKKKKRRVYTPRHTQHTTKQTDELTRQDKRQEIIK